MAKILTVTISDSSHSKFEEVKEIKHFGNNAEALEWLIQEGFKQVIQEKVKEAAAS